MSRFEESAHTRLWHRAHLWPKL